MVGVFVADTAQGVRVAVTGASSGVFRHAGLEAALTKSFAPEAVAGVAVDDAELNSDIHASASYRAQLIKVQTRVAVQQALA
jgi:carbon-monoxide dehydrogenase medium subunit